ncbi:FAD-dependent oxidoreductase [Streptomyces sp. NPDC017940]|uniref:FAD-dependent oxidoreductase n=1 Tax=Streptomyces sp. NPDC017940 TaxID=3365017 RepID=UPI00379E06BA
MKTVTVVGASLAGLHAARELRAQGYDGRLVIIGAEPHPPYGRPPLTKGFPTNAGAAVGTASPGGAPGGATPGRATPGGASPGSTMLGGAVAG